MSSSSVARQNRRMKQKQLPPIPSMRLSTLSCDGLQSITNSEKSLKLSDRNRDVHDISDSDNKDSQVKSSTKSEEATASATGCSFITCDVSSRPVGKVFIEEEKGFKAIDLREIFNPSNADCDPQTEFKEELAIDLACRSAQYFHSISNFCHGLLGGMSLLHVLLLFHLMASQTLTEDILKHFSFLSQPIHNLFNFLCIICCISAFDRYDIGNPKEFFHCIKKCNLKVIILIIYPVCLLLSLSTANVDEKFYLPQENSTVLESLKSMEHEDELFYWKTLSISKCFGVIFGWIIISCDTSTNLFYLYLNNIRERCKI